MSPNPVPAKAMSMARCGCRWSWSTWSASWPRATKDDPATLWIITRGVREGSSDAAVAQSPMWGTAGVIRAEQPQLWGGLIDLPDGAAISSLVPALAPMLRTPAKSILALRDGEFLAPGLSPVSGEPVREPLRCRPDAAYLITGGLGALGLLTAGWLADRGARRLILAGRTALPPRRDWDSDSNDAATTAKINAVRALEARGVVVEAVALDIGSAEAMQALLAKRDDEGAAPIRGVIHGAGITDAELFTEMEESRLRRTVWPKIAGAQVLHQAFPPGSLDFMFLTAAAGAVFGVPGQGAYAAANAYLDGLAQAAPPAGLPHRQPGLGGLARTRLRRRSADRAAGAGTSRVEGHIRRGSFRRLGPPRALRRRAGGHGSDDIERCAGAC